MKKLSQILPAFLLLASFVPISARANNPTETSLYNNQATNDGVFSQGAVTLGPDGNYYSATYSGGTAGLGAIVQTTPQGASQVIYSFQGGVTDGANPYGGLVVGSNGSLYGTTSSGGSAGAGTVFQVTTGGIENVVYNFVGGVTDGAFPLGSLVMGTSGNLYGVTLQGGTAGFGSVFSVSPAGNETVLYNFLGGTADGSYPVSLIQGSDGNFYGATQQGGSAGLGTFFEVNIAGSEAVLYSFQGGATDGSTPTNGLAQGLDGKFYGTTQNGGAADFGTVFQIGGGSEAKLCDFGGTNNPAFADGANPTSLLTGTDGQLYGTTLLGGANGLGTIFQVFTGSPIQGGNPTELPTYSFQGGSVDGATPIGGVAEVSLGDFIGTTTNGGTSGVGTVYQLTVPNLIPVAIANSPAASLDIGFTGNSGSTVFQQNAGAFQLTGGGQGVGIGNGDDGFQMAGLNVNGDLTLATEADGTQGAVGQSGLMFRTGVSPYASFMSLMVQGQSVVWEASPGGDAAAQLLGSVSVASGAKPYLTLTRSGNIFTAYVSVNGSLTVLGAVQLQAPTNLIVGLFGASGSVSSVDTYLFNNTQLYGAAVPPQ